MELTEHEWKRYGADIALHLLQTSNGSLEDITPIRVAIELGKSDLRDRARVVLDDLKKQSGDVHPAFRKHVKEAMIPVFKEALNIKGKCHSTRRTPSNADNIAGLGCKSKRDKLMRRFAKDHSASMFKQALEKMDAELTKVLRHHVSDLEGIAAGPVVLVAKQVQSLFGARKAAESPATRDITLQLQKENKHSLTSWRECWETPPSPREDHVMRGDMNIPEPEPINVEDGEDGVPADADDTAKAVQAAASGVVDAGMMLDVEGPV